MLTFGFCYIKVNCPSRCRVQWEKEGKGGETPTCGYTIRSRGIKENQEQIWAERKRKGMNELWKCSSGAWDAAPGQSAASHPVRSPALQKGKGEGSKGEREGSSRQTRSKATVLVEIRKVEGEMGEGGCRESTTLHSQPFLSCSVVQKVRRGKLCTQCGTQLQLWEALSSLKQTLVSNYYFFIFFKLSYFFPARQPVCGISAHSVVLWKWFQLALCGSWSSCQEAKRLKWAWQKLMSFLQNYLFSQKGFNNWFWRMRSLWAARDNLCLKSKPWLPPPALGQLYSRDQQGASRQGLQARTLIPFPGYHTTAACFPSA